MSIDKDTLTIVLNEYKILWDYYNTTLAERKNIYDWYFKIVALPATIVGILFNTDYIDLTSKNINPFLYGFYGVVFLAGVSMFVAYTFESATSTKYYININNIRNLLFELADNNSKKFLYIDEISGQEVKILSGKFFKSLTVPVINAGIGLLVLNNFHTWNIECNVLYYVIILCIHAILYKAIFKTIIPR